MRGKALKRQAQEIVYNVIGYFRSERDNRGALLALDNVLERTAAATGVSLSAVQHNQLNRQVKNNGGDPQELQQQTEDEASATTSCKPAKLPKHAADSSYSPGINILEESTKLRIRQIIYNSHYFRANPTVAQILEEIHQSGIELNGGKAVLLKIVREIGYKQLKVSGRVYFQELHAIAIARRQYLRSLRENANLATPRAVVYIDETWINLEAESPRLMNDELSDGKQKKKSGVSSGTGSSSTGFIVIHAGTEKGYVNGAVELVKRGSRGGGGDNDENMNSLFEAWVSKDLLPSLTPNSIIVMDNASYHCVQADKPPSISTSKAEMVTWLRKHNISCSPEMLQAELLHLIKRYKPSKSFRIDEMLEKCGHVVLHLPDFHPNLNPVEIIWAQAKRYYEEQQQQPRGLAGELNGASCAEGVWKEALATITPDCWAQAVLKVQAVQEDYWTKDCAIDARNEAVDFPIYDDSSDDSESETEASKSLSF